MAQREQIRKRVGIIFSNNENWIGGTYYIMNLISALNTLEDTQKPEIVVFTKNNTLDETKDVRGIEYPYMSCQRIIEGYYDYPSWKSFINKVAIRVFKKELFDERPKHLDICFPNPPEYHFAKIAKKYKVSWIPDFQEDHLPVFFTENEITARGKYQLELSKQNIPIIFSSFDALNDFKRLYSNNKNSTFVLQFAVTHPEYQSLDIKQLREKYQLPEKYFFAPNQFWAHKNHVVILKAIKTLKDKGKKILVAFSGKQEDYRNPDYFIGLQKFVAENNLEENIKFLGFIDRADQLQLMNNAHAIIQPSLFEGWSTVVEDAKAMNAYLICSDLKVHREQINENVSFFNPYDYEKLVETINIIIDNKPIINLIDYHKNINIFADNFVSIINKL